MKETRDGASEGVHSVGLRGGQAYLEEEGEKWTVTKGVGGLETLGFTPDSGVSLPGWHEGSRPPAVSLVLPSSLQGC